jgi:hypothetical protein
MLDDENIERVDKFGEKLRDQLQYIGRNAIWGAYFDLSKPAVSDYYRSPVVIEGKAIKKNWIQLNGHTYFHPSYSSPKPWKLQSRFSSHPGSLLWEKKDPYQYDRQPQEWSLGGSDVWAISYENLAGVLSSESEDDILDEILEDLRVSWSYANGQKLPTNDSFETESGENRVDITLSIDAKIWSDFQQVYALEYRSRKKLPKRPSYADLCNHAIDTALADYITKYNNISIPQDQE